MTFLRHATRHVHHTVANHIESELTTLGWLTAGSVPFDATPVEIFRTAAALKDVTAGQVRISLGREPHPDEQEMGGPLSLQEIPIFIDIFMDADATALALACDVRDILLGRLGGKRFLPVVDQGTSTEVAGWTIELDDVERVSPDASVALHWQVVKVTAKTYFPEEVY